MLANGPRGGLSDRNDNKSWPYTRIIASESVARDSRRAHSRQKLASDRHASTHSHKLAPLDHNILRVGRAL